MKLTKTELRQIIREELASLKEEAEPLFGMKPKITEPDKNGEGRYEYKVNEFIIDITYRLDATYPYKLAIYHTKKGFVRDYGLKPFKTKQAMEKDIKQILPKLKDGNVKTVPFKK